MDPVAQIALTRQLIDIDSTTGREAEAGRFLADTLRSFGYQVTEQHVIDGRFNVVAWREGPRGAVVPNGQGGRVWSAHRQRLYPYRRRIRRLNVERVRTLA